MEECWLIEARILLPLLLVTVIYNGGEAADSKGRHSIINDRLIHAMCKKISFRNGRGGSNSSSIGRQGNQTSSNATEGENRWWIEDGPQKYFNKNFELRSGMCLKTPSIRRLVDKKLPKRYNVEGNIDVLPETSREIARTLERMGVKVSKTKLHKLFKGPSISPDSEAYIKSSSIERTDQTIKETPKEEVCPSDFHVDYNPYRRPFNIYKAACRYKKSYACKCKTYQKKQNMFYFLGYTEDKQEVWRYVEEYVDITCQCYI